VKRERDCEGVHLEWGLQKDNWVVEQANWS
jgi:hypothetical protein